MENSRERLIARYAVDRGEDFEIITRYDDGVVRERVAKENPRAASLMSRYPAAIWFERKIADDFGIRFEGAFDHRPLLHHERWPQEVHPMRRDVDVCTVLSLADYRPYRYEAIGGDGVFEVAVGPIHAGIIEPGHFQFSQAGEDMLHQEVRHFYKYRGIEKMLEGKTLAEAAPIVARISGIGRRTFRGPAGPVCASAGAGADHPPLDRPGLHPQRCGFRCGAGFRFGTGRGSSAYDAGIDGTPFRF